MSLYPWQKAAWERLWQSPDKIPPAILLFGAEGIGKKDFARAMAGALLCEQGRQTGEICRTCPSCLWMAQGAHPDFIHITPDGVTPDKDTQAPTKRQNGTILIDQIRALDEFLYRTTHLGGPKVVVMERIDRLYPNAAKAFLKKLEEPPAGTYYLLTTAHRNQLLPTILSRCCSMSSGQPTTQGAIAWLQEQKVAQPEKWFARGGSPLVAYALAGEETDISHQVADIFLKLEPQNVVSLAEVIEKNLLADKSADSMDRLIHSGQMICHDVICQCSGWPIRFHPDLAPKILQLAQRAKRTDWLAYERRLIGHRKVALHPLNVRLLIEQILLESPLVLGNAYEYAVC